MRVREADYVILGGSTTGRVLANRLSERSDVSILVIEDDLVYANDASERESACGLHTTGQYETVPQQYAESRVLKQPQSRVLDGSSTISDGWFIAPSSYIIDGWASRGNTNWSYDDLFPYLKKSYTLQTPDAKLSLASQPNGLQALNELPDGLIEIYITDVADQNPILRAWNDTFYNMGYPTTTNFFSGDTIEASRAPFSVSKNTRRRSSAALKYGVRPPMRSKMRVLTNVMTQRIIFAGTAPNLTATGLEILEDGQISTVKARKEVILCSGAFSTPKVLELSGIGDKSRLEDLNIPVLIDNANVGENLQSHVMCSVTVDVKDGIQADEGIKALTSMPLYELSGPRNYGARKAFFNQFKPLSDETEAHYTLVRDILYTQDQTSCTMTLEPTPDNNPQQALLTLTATTPFSLGSSHITSRSASTQPRIDPNYFSHPADLEIMARNLLTLVNLADMSALAHYIHPPSNLSQINNVEAAKTFIRRNAVPTHHPCGTAAMLPREKGGVVGQDLIVYGTRNLRVVDASVFPLVPGCNPMATMYAVAEKAADLIKGGWSKGRSEGGDGGGEGWKGVCRS